MGLPSIQLAPKLRGTPRQRRQLGQLGPGDRDDAQPVRPALGREANSPAAAGHCPVPAGLGGAGWPSFWQRPTQKTLMQPTHGRVEPTPGVLQLWSATLRLDQGQRLLTLRRRRIAHGTRLQSFPAQPGVG